MNLKSYINLATLFCLFSAFALHGQGTFIYDQESADENYQGEEGAGAIQANQPMGQSFIPMLSSVGFIRLQLYSGFSNDGKGAIVSVNLRANSISGPILGTTATVVMPDGFFGGYVDFSFSTPVSVLPGVTYYFQPTVQNGDWSVGASALFNYAGGTVFGHGLANPASDLWFREGIVVPEPSSAALILVGSAFAWQRRRRSKRERSHKSS